MGSQAHLNLPIIDFSDESLTPGTSTWTSTRNDVRRALEEHGCFEAKFEKVCPELHHNVFSTAAELFHLPTEVKMRNTSHKPYFEYFGQYKSLPLYESLAVDHPTTFVGTQSFTKLMWPTGNDLFRESTQRFSERVADLDQTVMRMLFESYAVENYYDYYVKTTNYILRFFNYRVPEMNESNTGLRPHTDKTFLSIIHQSHVSGLQVKLKDDQWVDVQPSPTSFVIMAGEALMAWSNDRIPACYHQVTMNAKEKRYSIGLFSFLNGMVHVPENLGDDMNPIKYKSFDHFEFLRFDRSYAYGSDRPDERKKSNFSIQAFCGV